ncbi:MAG: amidohydrolase [Bacteroidales bacterium]|jgi:predicted amidohydrolase|nr:amidohydrolase [Bacteroidales bacterium]MCK9498452.1 amidohydrolase [Bacteroidales bacterium]MDY0315586.1 amidohydrolase [Bacteroidales bacterium]NLB87446.1 amidohydrolase [Bacteroidales bacterium]
MSKLKVSVLQTDIIWENAEENLKNYNKIILQNPGSDLYVLPEMFNSGFTNNIHDCAEDENGISLTMLSEISRISGAAIATSMILKENGLFYNVFTFVKPDGRIVKYKKRHLFKLGGEAEMFSKGDERVVFEFRGFKILFQICYDLRFPVWNRNVEDYDLMINVASWPVERRKMFDILLRARAIENLAYVIACNRIGKDGNNLIYNGGSCIIDPKGEEIALAKDNQEEIINAIIDTEIINEYRKSFPALNDRDEFTIIV